MNAQNNLYFTPITDWGNGGAEYSAFLINTSTSAEELIHFTAVAGAANVFVSTLANTNFDKIRFYRHPAGEVLQNQNWGWNATGQMPFDYVANRYYIMNSAIWNEPIDPGDNDIAKFNVTVYAEQDPIVIKIKKAGNTWEEIAVYSWSSEIGEENVQAFGSWPGTLLTAGQDGWYVINVPVSRPIKMILNNNGNGSQFNFIEDPTVSACYEITNLAATLVDCTQASIEDIFANKEVIRIEYFNLQGIKLAAEPQEGLFIAVPYYKGNIRGEAVKVLNRK